MPDEFPQKKAENADTGISPHQIGPHDEQTAAARRDGMRNDMRIFQSIGQHTGRDNGFSQKTEIQQNPVEKRNASAIEHTHSRRRNVKIIGMVRNDIIMLPFGKHPIQTE